MTKAKMTETLKERKARLKGNLKEVNNKYWTGIDNTEKEDLRLKDLILVLETRITEIESMQINLELV